VTRIVCVWHLDLFGAYNIGSGPIFACTYHCANPLCHWAYLNINYLFLSYKLYSVPNKDIQIKPIYLYFLIDDDMLHYIFISNNPFLKIQ